MRKFLSLTLGLALALGVVSTALAADPITDDQNVATTLNVTSSITLTGLVAAIDFGSAIPGDLAVDAPAFTLNVKTNNNLGYDLDFQVTDMLGNGATPDTIPATALEIAATKVTGVGTGSPSANFAGANTDKLIATSSERSLEAGDTYSTVVMITQVPFVESATYAGFATATASTL